MAEIDCERLIAGRPVRSIPSHAGVGLFQLPAGDPLAGTQGRDGGGPLKRAFCCACYVSFVLGYRGAMADLVIRLSPSGIPPAAAARLADELQGAATMTIGDETVTLTEEARSALSQILGCLASGQRVDVVPVTETLTTQQAANLLEVSRPTLVKMLESGLIPYEQPGVHRRVSRLAIDEFIASRAARRRAGLDALAETVDPDVPDEYVTTR